MGFFWITKEALLLYQEERETLTPVKVEDN
jgi:hypothetical protein